MLKKSDKIEKNFPFLELLYYSAINLDHFQTNVRAMKSNDVLSIQFQQCLTIQL